ncbi:MAG: hypothetical protein ACFFDC_11870 [Promethearchaeota archaeon]
MNLKTNKIGTISDLLFFVVGRSGSGKDTIMRKVVNILLLEDIPARILQRHITRQPDKTEVSLYVSEEEFLQKKSQKEYAFSWFVYDNWYGCPQKPLEQYLRRGEIILVNVSRSILYDAKEKYPRSKIILIVVPDEVAETRIKNRGREDSNHLADRFNRMHKKINMPFPDKVIQNEGDLEIAVQELSDYLRKVYQDSKIR